MYKPRDVDINWARLVIDLVADGGVLAYPNTFLIFRVDKAKKQLLLMNPGVLSDPDSKEVFEKTIAVFREINYEVK